MKCVSASRTSAETELAIFPPRRKLWSGWSDSANSTLHSVWSIRHDSRWPRLCMLSEYSSTEQARAEQEKGVFPTSRIAPSGRSSGLFAVIAVGVFLLHRKG